MMQTFSILIHRRRAPDATRSRRGRLLRTREHGQSLIELALLLPLVTILMLYAVDFGYFFLVAASLSSSSRNAAEYSIQGLESEAQPANLPTFTQVATIATNDISSLINSSTKTDVEVCIASVNGKTSATVSGKTITYCSTSGTTTTNSYTPDTDPESYPINRVDVTYTIQPPIPMTFFGVSLGVPTKFHRVVEMRTLN